MIIFDDVTRENIRKNNPNWLHFPDNPYRRLIICSSGSRKTNASLNLTNHQPNIDKILLYAKETYEGNKTPLIPKTLFPTMLIRLSANTMNFLVLRKE